MIMLSEPRLPEFQQFLGHIIDKDGIRADPDKTSAISSMDPPRSVSDLRRFMGLARSNLTLNYLNLGYLNLS